MTRSAIRNLPLTRNNFQMQNKIILIWKLFGRNKRDLGGIVELFAVKLPNLLACYNNSMFLLFSSSAYWARGDQTDNLSFSFTEKRNPGFWQGMALTYLNFINKRLKFWGKNSGFRNQIIPCHGITAIISRKIIRYPFH